MFGPVKPSVIAAVAALASLPLIMPQAANAQVDIHIGQQPRYPQQTQPPYPQQAQ